MGWDVRLRTVDVASRTIGGSVMILDLATNEYHSVGGSGVYLLELLAQETTPGQLAEALVERFGIDRARADGDVARFLSDLDERGLLE